MPITAFNIENDKIVRRAAAEDLPKVCLVTGANGVGKSTLIYALRRIDGKAVQGTGRVLYIGPHRVWRKVAIRVHWLWEEEKRYASMLAKDKLSSAPGVVVLDSGRTPDSTDEAPAFIKYILSQVEIKRQNLIVDKIDKNRLKYPDGHAPDIYLPFKELLAELLPHLSFRGVELSNRDNVRCLIDVEGGREPVDLDELSSGEKEIIALFMPLVEERITRILMEQSGHPLPDKNDDTVIIIDEPDQHIHPRIQKKMIKYINHAAETEGVQYILATHSYTLIKETPFASIYVMGPAGSADNQLRRLQSEKEKAALLAEY